MQEKNKIDTRLGDLLDLVRKLRGPDGCPWDREQTLPDLKQYLLEECYEVLDAIDSTRFSSLREELGDLLFQIVFLSRMAEEEGAFDLGDVIHGIHEKMVRRHPHVFGDVTIKDTDAVKRNWMKIKQAEGPSTASLLDSVPRSLPALQRAYRLSRRASRAGMDWSGPGPVLGKVREEIEELEKVQSAGDEEGVKEEMGDLLFSLANLARHLKINPEEALQQSNNKFLDRFQRMERRARRTEKNLETLSAEERDSWWEEIKKETVE